MTGTMIIERSPEGLRVLGLIPTELHIAADLINNSDHNYITVERDPLDRVTFIVFTLTDITLRYRVIGYDLLTDAFSVVIA